MTLFTNPNFIDHIVKSQGADQNISQQHYTSLQTLIELETRLLIEKAIKFMYKDRRDTLSLEDIVNAAKDSGNADLVLLSQRGKFELHAQNQMVVREDYTYVSTEELFRQEMRALSNTILEGPRLRGSWISIGGRVPSTNENVNLKSLSQLMSTKQHEEQEQRKLFHVIKDENYQVLTREQTEYFRRTALLIINDAGIDGLCVDGDLSRLVPFFVSFIARQLNETSISFLLGMLINKYIEDAVQFNLKNILNILLAYKGAQSYAVGQKITELVKRYCHKYPVLLKIYQGYEDKSYSTILKRISFELELGQLLPIDEQILQRCKVDAINNDLMAVLCLRALLQHSSQLQYLRELLYKRQSTLIFWHPCPETQTDPYLGLL